MLGAFPVKFDGVAMPWADKWVKHHSDVEASHTTEAGTEQVSILRKDRLTIDAEYHTDSRGLRRYQQYRNQDTVAVSLYDALSGDYETRTMRIRGFAVEQLQDTATRDTVGLYIVTFSLEEL